MSRDYTWARRSIPSDFFTVRDLSLLLGLGRHQTRLILIRSGLPCRLIKRHWRSPTTGRGYTRRAWAIPPSVALLLMLKQVERQLSADCHRLKLPLPEALSHGVEQLTGAVRRTVEGT